MDMSSSLPARLAAISFTIPTTPTIRSSSVPRVASPDVAPAAALSTSLSIERAFLRAANVLQKAWLIFKAATNDEHHTDVRWVTARLDNDQCLGVHDLDAGDLAIEGSNPVLRVTSYGIRDPPHTPFRANISLHERAILSCFLECGYSVEYLHNLIIHLLKGTRIPLGMTQAINLHSRTPQADDKWYPTSDLVTSIDEINMEPKNQNLTVAYYTAIRPARFTNRTCDHRVLRVCLAGGARIFALDITGMQYGWSEAALPWQEYVDTRVRTWSVHHKLSLTERRLQRPSIPVGSAVQREYDQLVMFYFDKKCRAALDMMPVEELFDARHAEVARVMEAWEDALELVLEETMMAADRAWESGSWFPREQSGAQRPVSEDDDEYASSAELVR